MNYRTFIIFLVILVAFVSLLLVGFMATYSIDPTLLGFEPKRTATDSLRIVKEKKSLPLLDKVIITKKQYKQLQQNIEKFEKQNSQNYHKYESSNKIIDSLKKVIQSKDTEISKKYILNDSIKKFSKVLNDQYSVASNLKDSINKLTKNIMQLQNDVKSKDNKITQMEKFYSKKADSLTIANYRQFADMFKNASPTEIAKIIERIDEREAAKILKLLPKKQAGKIIEALSPERAAVIMLLGSDQ
jgi:flagellar motility protein MotE (MotC chaperone)